MQDFENGDCLKTGLASARRSVASILVKDLWDLIGAPHPPIGLREIHMAGRPSVRAALIWLPIVLILPLMVRGTGH